MRSEPSTSSNGHPAHATNGAEASGEGRAAIRHVAVIMDGNGRWAEARGMARIQGHEHGVESVRAVTRHAALKGGANTREMLDFESSNLADTVDYDFVRSR